MQYYITSYQAKGSDAICNFPLYSEDVLKEDRDFVIRVNTPDYMKTAKRDGLLRTKEDVSLNELGYDVLIRRNKEWVKWNNLKPFMPHEFDKELARQGYHQVPHIGYLNGEEFRRWFRKLHPELFVKSKRTFNTAYYS